MLKVCLVAEGSYPYVAGGVGKWTHDLIQSLPDVEFTVVALWPSADHPGTPKYPRPRNVKEIRDLYLMSDGPKEGRVDPGVYEGLDYFHRRIKEGDAGAFAEVVPKLSACPFLKEKKAWDFLGELYEAYAPPNTSFPDYFWTWRATHAPVFRLLESRLPETSVVHCISTGYAGLLGAVHRVRTGTPMLTTEHGIYTVERHREILDAEWIPGENRAERERRKNFFKEWWDRMFRAMERIAYRMSDRIVALFEGTRRYQIEHGAPAERTQVIPNGIASSVLDDFAPSLEEPGVFRVGLVGRVVPIKDIKAFVTACRIASDQMRRPALRAFVLGPFDEDRDYGRQCRELASLLGLDGKLVFTGPVDMRAHYGKLDAVVLTSLSEGQPLALLEAHARRIPAVATDVGSCREILEGASPEDRALGPSGIVTAAASPEETARALVDLATHPERRRRMGEAGRKRIERFYRWEDSCTAYRELYGRLADGGS